MGWKTAEESAKNAGGGKFIRLEDDGDSIVLCLPYCGAGDDDEPIVSEYVWNEKLDRGEPYTKEHKERGEKPQARYNFNAMVKTEGKVEDELKVLQANTGTFKAILACRDKYPLEETWIELKRMGKKKDKKTKYAAMYDSKMTAEETAKAKALAKDRHDLRNLEEDETEGGDDKKKGGKSNGASSNDGLISATQADELLPRLKALPEEKRRGFLKEFNVPRVRDLKASEFEKAKKWISDAGTGDKPQDDAFS